MKTELDALTAALTANGDRFTPIYGSNSWQNVQIDEAQFPVVCYDMPTVVYEAAKSGYIGETYPVTLFFAYKSELEWTGAQHEEVIEKANVAAREWITRCNKAVDGNGNRTLEIVKINAAQRVRCVFNVCASGILVQMDIKPTVVASVCL